MRFRGFIGGVFLPQFFLTGRLSQAAIFAVVSSPELQDDVIHWATGNYPVESDNIATLPDDLGASAHIDVAGGSFALLAESPAIDKGAVTAPDLKTASYAGNPRPRGAAPKMGALEAEESDGGGEEQDDDLTQPSESGGGSIAVSGHAGGMASMLGPLIGFAGLRLRQSQAGFNPNQL